MKKVGESGKLSKKEVIIQSNNYLPNYLPQKNMGESSLLHASTPIATPNLATCYHFFLLELNSNGHHSAI